MFKPFSLHEKRPESIIKRVATDLKTEIKILMVRNEIISQLAENSYTFFEFKYTESSVITVLILLGIYLR